MKDAGICLGRKKILIGYCIFHQLKSTIKYAQYTLCECGITGYL